MIIFTPNVATIWKDPLKGADNLFLSEKDLKKEGHGAFDSVVEANSGVTVLRWFDNGLVQMVSNFIGRHNDGKEKKNAYSSKLKDQQRWSNIIATWGRVFIYVTCYSQ